MRPLLGLSWVFVVLLAVACSNGGSANDAAQDRGQAPGGSGGAGGVGSGGQGGGGSGGRDAASEVSTPQDAPRDTASGDRPRDTTGDGSVDGGTCKERGYECPGDRICMVCEGVNGPIWVCLPPGLTC